MKVLKSLVAVACGLPALWSASNASEEAALPPVDLNISAQPLSDALNEFARQSGLQIVFYAGVSDGRLAPQVVGQFTPEAALKKMLASSGLTYAYLNGHTVAIRAIKLSQADDRSTSTTPTPGSSNEDSHVLAEVIVTAQKREERLLDVPVPVTVLSGEVLAQSSQLRLQDYFQKVPGLNLQFGGEGEAPILSIRGLNNGAGGAAVVGVVIDDVPYGSATGLSARGQPDIDPGDLAQVEVLRGPQGTLYGANAMGGLVKFVTVNPSTERLSGRLQVGTSNIRHGTGDGYDFRGSINVPVNDTMAFRASAFRDQQPGYIDNIQSGEKGVNRRTSEGGRLAGLWKPSDDFSLKVSAMLQDSKRYGTDAATAGPGFSDLQIRVAPNTYTLDEKTQAYSAILNAKFGSADFVSLTGYNVDTFKPNDDGTRLAGYFYADYAQQYYGVHGEVLVDTLRSRRFSQEFRASMPIGDQFTWMLGVFYTDEKDVTNPMSLAADPATGIPQYGKSILSQPAALDYKEYAAFTNLKYDITDRLDVQVGGRVSQNKQTYNADRSGPLAIAFFIPPFAVSNLHSKETPVTYLFTPEYKVTPDLMVYARLASGYRPGGPVPTCTAGIPCQYYSEKTKNYELGLKGDFLEHALSVDASLYYIDWKDIQVGLSNSQGLGYTVNEGKAKSQGLELSAEARPVRGLTLSGWVAWSAAEYKSGFDPTLIQSDERLPFSSRFSGNLAADEEFEVSGPLTGFIGASVSYMGERLGTVQSHSVNGVQLPCSLCRADLPAYAQTDVHAGLRYDTWTVNAFVNNVTDKRGILAGGIDYQYQYADPNTYSYIQPRTIGLSVVKTF